MRFCLWLLSRVFPTTFVAFLLVRFMPIVAFNPEALAGKPGPWVTMLEEAGFTVRYPEDRTFARGMKDPHETIRVLKDACQ